MAVKTFSDNTPLSASDTNTFLANAGLVFVKSQTVGSGVLTVTVTGAFSSTYDNYEIIYSNGTMTSSSADSQLNLQLGPSSVSGYNSQYYVQLLYAVNSSTPLAAFQNNGGQYNWFGGGSTTNAYGHCRLFGPNLATHTRYESEGYLIWNDGGFGRSSGIHKSTAQYTDFTISVSGTGTMSGGTIIVYGYRKP